MHSNNFRLFVYEGNLFCVFFSQLSSFVIADIDEGSVTSPPRIQRLPTYAAELYKFRYRPVLSYIEDIHRVNFAS